MSDQTFRAYLLHVGKVQSFCSDVGGNEHIGALALLESHDCLITLFLVFSTVC